MAPPLDSSILQRGFRFTPTPLEAVTYYLPRLIAGKPMHPTVAPFIHDADIYACEPGALAAQFRPTPKKNDRFFFTTCRRQKHKPGKDVRYMRAAGPGSWASQHSTIIKDGADAKVGEMRKLRYKKSGDFTDWLMDEFSCCLEDAVDGDRERVLCRIYVSPNADPNSTARRESAAFFTRPALETVVVTQAAAAKRPAATVAEPPCPKRIRGAVVSAAPSAVVQPAGLTTSFAPPRPCVPRRVMAPPLNPSATVTRAPAWALPPAPVRIIRPMVRPSVDLTPPVAAAPLTPRPAPAACLPVPVASPDPDVLPSTEASPAPAAEDDFAKDLEDSLLAYEAEEELDPFAAALSQDLEAECVCS